MTKLRVITHDASFLTANAVAILVFPGQKLSLSGKKLDQTSRKGLGKVLLEESFLVKNGRVLVYYAPGTKAKKIFAVASENNRSRKTDLREAAQTLFLLLIHRTRKRRRRLQKARC